MEAIAGEYVTLLTACELYANNHVVLAVANPHNRQCVSLCCRGYLRIAIVEPRRLGRLIDLERPVDDNAVLPVAESIKRLRREHQQSG